MGAFRRNYVQEGRIGSYWMLGAGLNVGAANTTQTSNVEGLKLNKSQPLQRGVSDNSE